MKRTPTKKLFNAIVVIGMAASLGCSSDNAPADASTDSNSAADTAIADSSTPDTSMAQDSGTKDSTADTGDGFSGWLGC